eukprot:SM000105S13911  [mRNA]  locus=s105:306688:310827:- [translate_table: standard]
MATAPLSPPLPPPTAAAHCRSELPQFLLAAGLAGARQAIAVTQPRRVAAVAVAARVAEEMGVALGAEVGYSVRFDDASSPGTRIKFLTDGMLLRFGILTLDLLRDGWRCSREALLDPLLRRYAVVVVDEAHERTASTDLLLGLLKQVQARRLRPPVAAVAGGAPVDEPDHRKVLRREAAGLWHATEGANGATDGAASAGPLKLVVMSATLDALRLRQYFGSSGGEEGSRRPSASAAYVRGRQHRVEVLYTDAPQADYLDAALVTVLQSAASEPPLTAGECGSGNCPLPAAAADGGNRQVHREEGPGDVLVFLTGQEEIEAMERLLRDRAAALPPPAAGGPSAALAPVPIYAALPSEQQLRAFHPAPPGVRKVLLIQPFIGRASCCISDALAHPILGFGVEVAENRELQVILATNIAETSVTIPGVRYVIDSGLVKARAYSARAGTELLEVVPISKAQARQRSGRAGREGPGKCFRLYTEDAFEALANEAVPEVARCNLAGIVLQLKALGVRDVLDFDFLDPPPRAAIAKALEQLYVLGALTLEGDLSEPLGARMARLPLEPLYAKALLTAAGEDFACGAEMLGAVAMLSVESVFFSPQDKQSEVRAAKQQFVSPDGDHCTLVNVFQAYQAQGTATGLDEGGGNSTAVHNGDEAGKRQRGRAAELQAWCREHFLNARSLRKAADVHRQVQGLCKGSGLPLASCKDDLTRFRRCLAASFFLNAAQRQPNGTYRALASGQIVSIHPSSVLFGKRPACIVFNELVRTSRQYARDVTAVDPLWLPELAPQFYQSRA